MTYKEFEEMCEDIIKFGPDNNVQVDHGIVFFEIDKRLHWRLSYDEITQFIRMISENVWIYGSNQEAPRLISVNEKYLSSLWKQLIILGVFLQYYDVLVKNGGKIV